MEYHSMKELFAVADVEKCSPGIIACRVEAEESGKSYEEIWSRMKYTIPIFRESIQKGLSDTQKSASGLEALAWWKEGRIDEIAAYCKQDVLVTRDLYTFGRDNGYLLFSNKAGKIVRLPVEWE